MMTNPESSKPLTSLQDVIATYIASHPAIAEATQDIAFSQNISTLLHASPEAPFSGQVSFDIEQKEYYNEAQFTRLYRFFPIPHTTQAAHAAQVRDYSVQCSDALHNRYWSVHYKPSASINRQLCYISKQKDGKHIRSSHNLYYMNPQTGELMQSFIDINRYDGARIASLIMYNCQYIDEETIVIAGTKSTRTETSKIEAQTIKFVNGQAVFTDSSNNYTCIFTKFSNGRLQIVITEKIGRYDIPVYIEEIGAIRDIQTCLSALEDPFTPIHTIADTLSATRVL